MATGVDAKLLKTTKFPPEFNQKVDMTKVNLQVMKKWIAGKVTEILGTEDDVVIELIFNLIDGPRYPDIKGLQIQLTGFLDKDTPSFCKELWKLFLSAQTSPQGVPKELLEAKKLELIQEKIEAEKAAEEARLRREEFERRDRGRGRGGRGGGDSWRGGRRDDRDFGPSRGPRGGFGRGGGRSPSPRGYRGPPADRGGRRGGRDAYGRERDIYETNTVTVEVTVCPLGFVPVEVEVEECECGQSAFCVEVSEPDPATAWGFAAEGRSQTVKEPPAWWSQPVCLVGQSISGAETSPVLAVTKPITVLLQISISPLAGETHVADGHGAAPGDLVDLCRPRGVGEEEGQIVAAAEQEEAGGAATRLPVFLQTLLATEELTIPGPKVDDDREVLLRGKHLLSDRFVPAQQTKTAEQLANEQKEKELRERLRQMRTSRSDPSGSNVEANRS
ncbi:hypothetical protein NKR19_g933 [Coniochaeta hoffmannii]|uniref:PWI domain-containing protein n=1 Tax=Coniochaeta hoffmannii TaxID=91930 RepID=A0AA38W0H9_9PEZI|nr:hypothetical protein NKR19_g933 [Coniochaeta hoffmannii]